MSLSLKKKHITNKGCKRNPWCLLRFDMKYQMYLCIITQMNLEMSIILYSGKNTPRPD